MKSYQLRFGVFVTIGILLLIMPLCTYSADNLMRHPHPIDLSALRCLATSIVGLALIVLFSVSHSFDRRVLEDTTA